MNFILLAVETINDQANALIAAAAANGDKIALAVGLVALAVVTVLKVLGKDLPVVDQAVAFGLKLFNSLRGVKQSAPPADPAKQGGLADVVNIKPPEEKK